MHHVLLGTMGGVEARDRRHCFKQWRRVQTVLEENHSFSGCKLQSSALVHNLHSSQAPLPDLPPLFLSPHLFRAPERYNHRQVDGKNIKNLQSPLLPTISSLGPKHRHYIKENGWMKAI